MLLILFDCFDMLFQVDVDQIKSDEIKNIAGRT